MASGCYNLLRWTVFVLNFIFWIAGIGVFGVSLWLLFDADFARTIGGETGLNSFYTGVYIMLGVGLLMSFFGFLGCCGALRESQSFLIAFFILLLIVFIAELVCGILMYYYQADLRKYVEDSVSDSIYLHYEKPAYKKAVDNLQTTLKCCGARSYTDWLQVKSIQGGKESDTLNDGGLRREVGSVFNHGEGKVPASCCTEKGKRLYANCGQDFGGAPLNSLVSAKPDEGIIFATNCNKALFNYFNESASLLILLAVGIGCLQLFGMVLTMLLCCCISNEKRAMKGSETGGANAGRYY